jgi:hypothetical protein
MNRRTWGLVAAALVAISFVSNETSVHAQYYQPYYQSYQLSPLYYYPHHFFPHNYWPAQSPRWPEPQGAPYMRPPAYQAYPAFKEPGWRYEMWQAQPYYRGNHFWLDQF